MGMYDEEVPKTIGVNLCTLVTSHASCMHQKEVACHIIRSGVPKYFEQTPLCNSADKCQYQELTETKL